MIKKKEFEEQEADLKDFEKMIERVDLLLEKITAENNNKNIDMDIESLAYLHVNYCNIEWHVERVHELIKKMIGKYTKYTENKPKSHKRISK